MAVRQLRRDVIAVAGATAVAGLIGTGLASGASQAAAKRHPKTRTVRVVCKARAQHEPAFTAGLLRAAGLLYASGHTTVVCRVPLLQGKQGPRGRTGPPGPPGQNATSASTQVIVHRRVLARTATPQVDGGNIQNLAVVRGVHFDALCRKTSGTGAGSGPQAGNTFDRSLWTAADPTFVPNGESEAKVLVWSETSSLSFKGDTGPRANVPAGQPSFDLGTPSPNEPPGQGSGGSGKGSGSATAVGEGGPGNGPDPVQGEGQHMLVHASNEEGDQNRPLQGVMPFYGFSSGWVGTDSGVDLLVSFIAGVNVLGAGPNNCVFAGVVQPIG